MKEMILVPVEALIPYQKNAKKHPESQIKKLAEIIQEFGFRQPILVDKDMVIVTGHGRLLAAKHLGLKKVPVTIADDLTPEQTRAYRIADNKIAETDWEQDLLEQEIREIEEGLLPLLGFEDEELEKILKETENNWDGYEGENKDLYTKKIKIPLYEPKGEKPKISDLVFRDKCDELIDSIMLSTISDEEKDFLIIAAGRHNVFNYQKIAEYYCHASKEFQELAEKSALVIIDFDKAIENGFVVLTKEIAEAFTDDQPA